MTKSKELEIMCRLDKLERDTKETNKSAYDLHNLLWRKISQVEERMEFTFVDLIICLCLIGQMVLNYYFLFVR
jgi:hypothetical protein